MPPNRALVASSDTFTMVVSSRARNPPVMATAFVMKAVRRAIGGGADGLDASSTVGSVTDM